MGGLRPKDELLEAIKTGRNAGLSDDDIATITSFFLGGSYRNKKNVLTFLFHTGSETVELLSYQIGRKGDICGVDLLCEEHKRKVTELSQLITSEATRTDSFIASRIMFSQKEMTGQFRWNDTFRIRPILDDIALGETDCFFSRPDALRGQKGPKLGPPFPFILEVKVKGTQDSAISSVRAIAALDQYGWLLSTLIVGVTSADSLAREPQWVAAWSDTEQAIQYKLYQPSLSWQGSPQTDDFVECNRPEVDYFVGDNYYDALLAMDRKMLFPSKLCNSLDIFNSLNAKARLQFLRSCYYFELAEIRRRQNYNVIVELASAIECLLPEADQTTCKSCHQEIHSIGRRFRDFLDSYAPTEDSIKKLRKRFYVDRSQMVHGAEVRRVDYGWLSPMFEDDSVGLLAYFHTRRAIVTWLSAQQAVG
jgi:hypothetical protein